MELYSYNDLAPDLSDQRATAVRPAAKDNHIIHAYMCFELTVVAATMHLPHDNPCNCGDTVQITTVDMPTGPIPW